MLVVNYGVIFRDLHGVDELFVMHLWRVSLRIPYHFCLGDVYGEVPHVTYMDRPRALYLAC